MDELGGWLGVCQYVWVRVLLVWVERYETLGSPHLAFWRIKRFSALCLFLISKEPHIFWVTLTQHFHFAPICIPASPLFFSLISPSVPDSPVASILLLFFTSPFLFAHLLIFVSLPPSLSFSFYFVAMHSVWGFFGNFNLYLGNLQGEV